MKVAIVGYTGLVGGYLSRIFPTASLYNRANIHEIANKSFDLLLITGLPAEKWKANLEPLEDLANVEVLKGWLKSVSAVRTVLISTVDVFASPVGVNEASAEYSQSPGYGQNRRNFEVFVQKTFRDTWIIRLPGLVGDGLKKNVLFDLKNGKDTGKVAINSQFQFYPLHRLERDLDLVVNAPSGIFHFSAEPISMLDLCENLGVSIDRFAPESENAPMYDMITANSLSGKYMVSKTESMAAIRKYLK